MCHCGTTAADHIHACERGVANLQFISLPLWQHHGDRAARAGGDQMVEGEFCAAAALSSVRRWAVLIRTRRMGRGLQWWAVVCVRAKAPAGRKGTQEVCLPGSLTTGMREVASPRAVTSRTYTASGKETHKVNVKHVWSIKSSRFMDETVCIRLYTRDESHTSSYYTNAVQPVSYYTENFQIF